MPGVQRRRVAALLEALAGVLAQRLQEPVAPGAVGEVVRHHQRLVHQPAEQVVDLVAVHRRRRRRPPPPPPASSRRRRRPAGRTAPAPARSAGRSSSPRSPAASAGAAARCGSPGQQAEAVLEPGEQLVGGQRPDAGGGQLDGQRDAVQPAADLGDRRGVPVGDGEAGRRPPGPVDEQPHRRVAGQARRRRRSAARPGTASDGTRQGTLAGDAQRLPAGGQDA